VALVVAVLLALFVLPRPWDWIAVSAAAVYEVVSTWLWWHWSRTRKAVVGTAALVGASALVTEDCRPTGWVRVSGELWRAECADGVSVGERVRIAAVQGLTLVVERFEG
jgi:membrane protein implicated in regulation of membrane protease activity